MTVGIVIAIGCKECAAEDLGGTCAILPMAGQAVAEVAKTFGVGVAEVAKTFGVDGEGGGTKLLASSATGEFRYRLKLVVTWVDHDIDERSPERLLDVRGIHRERPGRTHVRNPLRRFHSRPNVQQ